MHTVPSPPRAGNVGTAPPPAVYVLRNTARDAVTEAELPFLRSWPEQIARPARDILADVVRRTGGWPKERAGRLYVPKAGGGVRVLKGTAGLFAWLHDVFDAAGRSGVSWRSRSDCVSKGVFLAYCVQHCEPLDAPADGGAL